MNLYASITGTRRNLDAMRAAGFRHVLTSGSKHRPVPGFRYGIDNGKFRCWIEGTPWDEAEFIRTIETWGPHADWIVVPDIVAAGAESLALSVTWLPVLQVVGAPLLVAVQDGMTPADLERIVSPGRVGIFLGGTTEWKIATMLTWGRWCAERGVYFHVGRVNTAKRIHLAIAAGADSCDGTSATRFAKTVPLLRGAAAQQDMLCPRRS